MGKKRIRSGDGRILARNRNGDLHWRKERSDGWTEAQRTAFLDHLAASCNIEASAKAAGRTPYSAKGLRRSDSDFAAQWDAALETAYATLETMALEGAQRALSRSCAQSAGGDTAVAEEGGALSDMTTKEALELLERHRKAVLAIRRGGARNRTDGRTATARETYLAIIERMRVLRIRLEDGE